MCHPNRRDIGVVLTAIFPQYMFRNVAFMRWRCVVIVWQNQGQLTERSKNGAAGPSTTA